MSEIISQALTAPVQIIIAVLLILVILLWLLSIFWVHRDAKTRSTSTLLWTIVAIVPIAGLIAYCLLRPPYTSMDEDEQGMELNLIQRQLDAYGNCPQCGYPTESEYILCPSCHTRLRNRCAHCGHSLNLEWTVCPYCAAPVGRAQGQARRPAAQPATQAMPQGAASQATQPSMQPVTANDPFAPTR